jgi:uncharacterized peroxidase-related enzyme
MTWIKTVSPQDSPEVASAMQDQQRLYPFDYTREGQAQMRVPEIVAKDSIVRSHTLLPEVLRHAFSTFGALMNPDLPLTRRDHELIATVVSASNRCYFCTESHIEFLRLAALDEEIARTVGRDWRSADLSDAERAMLDYTEKLTLRSASISEDDIHNLRAHGFDDTAILQINLIASWFNYINRAANGLGVGRE